MPENMSPSGVNNAWREHAARHKRHWLDMDGSVTTAGTSTAYTATLNKGGTTLANLGPMILELHTATGATPTLAVNGGTAKNLCWPDGTNVTTSEIATSTRVLILYDADKDKFVVLSGARRGDVAGPASSTDNELARFDSTTGKIIQGGGLVTLGDTGSMTWDDTASAATAFLMKRTGGAVAGAMRRVDSATGNNANLSFQGTNASSTALTLAEISMDQDTATAGAEDGSLRIRTTRGGTAANRVHLDAGMYMQGATGGDQGGGTFNATALYDDGVIVGPLVVGTADTTLSGTTGAAWTSLPAGIKRLTVFFYNLSLDDTDNFLVQVGDSGGLRDL
jgi:hypothetical protein